jgi:hypothetical protein
MNVERKHTQGNYSHQVHVIVQGKIGVCNVFRIFAATDQVPEIAIEGAADVEAETAG